MALNRNRRQYVRTRIRVSDKNNELASYAALGRAVGWAKQKAAALQRRLWDKNNDPRLPYRTWHFAMPVSGISMIEIKTNPWDGTWSIRIIGGVEVAGSFIWNAVDFETIFPVGTLGFSPLFDRQIGIRDTILVKAAGFGGEYTTTIQDLVAGNIDWKGFERTTKADGSPLPEPKTDVITISGPENRYGPSVRTSRMHTHFAWANGALYARAPFYPTGNSTPDPVNDVSQDLQRLRGQVIGMAIQRDPDTGEARDVMITDTVFNPLGVTPLELRSVDWHAFWRPAGASLETNGIFREASPPFFNNADPPDSKKWRFIGTVPGPSDVNGQRYVRHRTWFFNKSGTQACCMVPVNQVGDYLPAPSSYPASGTVPAFNLQQVSPENFPNYMRQAVLTVDAFAETFTVAVSDRSAAGITKTRVVQPSSCGGGGSFTQGCPPGPAFRDFPDTVGSSSSTRSDSSSTTFNGGNKWQVACDFKGDTLVPAFLEFTGSGSATSNLQITGVAGSETTASYSATENEDAKYTLSFGSVNEIVGQQTVVNSTNIQSTDRNTVLVGSGGDRLNGSVSILYMDIRNDLLLLSVPFTRDQTRLGGDGKMNSGFSNSISVTGPVHRIIYASSSGTEDFSSYIRLIQGSGVLTEWTWDTSRTIGGIGLLSGIFGTTFFFTTVFGICPPNGTASIFRTDTSTPPICAQALISLGSTLVTDINGPPGLESFGNNARLEQVNSGANHLMSPYRLATVAVDTAGNVAMSVQTPELLPFLDEARGVTIRERVSFTRDTLPRTQPILNFLSGSDIVVVSNQVDYIDPGLDPVDPLDDVTLPPVATVSGHATPVVGPILEAENAIGLGGLGNSKTSINVL